jgi:TP901 family phage tail tape measure protein
VANVELATAYISLVPTMQGVQGKVAEALLPAGAEADKAGKSSGGMFAGGFGGALGAAAIGVAATGAAVAGAAVGLYKVGAVFDDVTDTIRVGTGASGDALTGLVDIAKQVGTQVPTDFATAGSTVADLNQRLGLSGDTLSTVAQQYIQAGNILGETVDVNTTTAAFSAFGIEGANVEGAMDTLFRVSQSTGIGLNELASQVQTSAAPLQNLGFSFEETASLAGTLDKAGLNTSAVMSSMGKGLVTLAKAGEEPQAAFKRVTGELQGFVKSGDTAGALDLASKVFGTKGASQFVGALQSGKVNLDDLTGAAGMTSDTILGLGKETADAAESWTMIKSKALLALEPMGAAVFDLAGKGLGFLNEKMDGVTGKISDFGAGMAGIVSVLATGDFKGPIFGMEEDSGFVDVLFNIREAFQTIAPIVGQVFGTIGTTLGPLIPQFFALFSAISPIQTIFQAIQPLLPQLLGMFSQLASVIGQTLGTALTALLPVFVQLQGVFVSVFQQVLAQALPVIVQLVTMLGETFAQLLPIIVPIITTLAGLAVTLISQLMPIFMQLVSTVLPMVVTIFGAVLQAIGPLISMLAGLLIPIIQALMPVVVTVFGGMAGVISSIMQIVMGVIQVVTGLISGNWSQVWEGIGNIFGGIWNWIVTLVSVALEIVGTVIGSALNFWWGLISGTLGAIGQFFIDMWNNIVSFLGDVWNNIVNGVIAAVTWYFTTIFNAFTAVWTFIGDVFNNILNFFAGVWNNIVGGVVGAVSAYISIVSNGFNFVLGFIRSILGNVGNFFAETWNNITRGISEFVGGIGRFFDSIPGTIMGALSGAGTWLFDAGKNIVNGLFDGIKSLAGTIGNFFLGLLPGWIVEPFKVALGIHSPSRVFRGLGVNIGQGLILGVGDMHSDIESAVNDMVTVPSPPAYGANAAAGDFRTSGGFGSTFNIYETDDPIATAHAVSRRQSALAS